MLIQCSTTARHVHKLLMKYLYTYVVKYIRMTKSDSDKVCQNQISLMQFSSAYFETGLSNCSAMLIGRVMGLSSCFWLIFRSCKAHPQSSIKRFTVTVRISISIARLLNWIWMIWFVTGWMKMDHSKTMLNPLEPLWHTLKQRVYKSILSSLKQLYMDYNVSFSENGGDQTIIFKVRKCAHVP